MWNFRKWLIENTYKPLKDNDVSAEAMEATKKAYIFTKASVQGWFPNTVTEVEKSWTNSVKAKNALEHGGNTNDAIKYHQQAYESHKSVVKQLQTQIMLLNQQNDPVNRFKKCEELNKQAGAAHYWAAMNLQNQRGDNDIDWRPNETMPEDFYAA